MTTTPSSNSEEIELAEVMKTLRRPVYPLSEIIALGPRRRTALYEDIAAGKLKTFRSHGRRFALAADFARYILALKAEGGEGHRAGGAAA